MAILIEKQNLRIDTAITRIYISTPLVEALTRNAIGRLVAGASVRSLRDMRKRMPTRSSTRITEVELHVSIIFYLLTALFVVGVIH